MPEPDRFSFLRQLFNKQSTDDDRKIIAGLFKHFEVKDFQHAIADYATGKTGLDWFIEMADIYKNESTVGYVLDLIHNIQRKIDKASDSLSSITFYPYLIFCISFLSTIFLALAGVSLLPKKNILLYMSLAASALIAMISGSSLLALGSLWLTSKIANRCIDFGTRSFVRIAKHYHLLDFKRFVPTTASE